MQSPLITNDLQYNYDSFNKINTTIIIEKKPSIFCSHGAFALYSLIIFSVTMFVIIKYVD